jgi:outer membrane protein assembly factor BamB
MRKGERKLLKINKLYVTMLVLCLLMSLVFVGFTLNSSSVSAQQETTIYIDPTPVTANVCENFTVALNVKDVADLYCWQVKLSFDPDLLECLGATEGPFLPPPTIFPPPIIDNDAGTVYMCCSEEMTPSGQSGSGTLTTITFHCTGIGGSALHLHDTILLNSSAVLVVPPPNLGDVNNDSKVDMKDLAILIRAYGSKVGDPRYDSRADLNSDGVVDIIDLMILTRNYGHVYPPFGSSYALQPVDNVIAHIVEDGYVTQGLTYLDKEEPLAPVHLHKEEPLEPVHLHPIGPFDPSNPIGSEWHELHPQYCKYYILTSWIDTDESGSLTPSDQIDFVLGFTPEQWDEFWSMGDVNRDGYINMEDANLIAAKFGWHGPPGGIPEDINSDGTVNMKDASICALNYGKDIWAYFGIPYIKTWYHLDRVTWTIFITDIEAPPPPLQLYAELEYPPKQTPPPITDPIGTDWHMVYPPESYCRRFHVESWTDNGNGFLDYCDYIDGEYMDQPGLYYYYHVEEVVMDLILTKKCFYEPIGTEWHELYPTFSQYYDINSWEDTNGDGKLSASDQIDLHLDWPKFHHDNPLIGYSASTAPNTNATLWTYNTTAPVWSSPAIVDNVLYIGSDNGILYALNAQTGAVIWTYTTGGAIKSSPAVFYGKVYFLSTDGFVYALDAGTGALVWSVLIDPPLPPRVNFWPWSSPAVHSGRVFIAASTGWLYCLNAFNGAIIWNTFIGGNPNSPITVANNKVFSGTHNFNASDPTLVALNELTGAIIWTYNYTAWHLGLVGMVNCNGAAVTDGDGDGDLEVYFGIVIWPAPLDNTAICLDEATGNEIWTQNINGDSTSTPAVHNGKVFIGSDDFKVYALDAATGAYIWTYSTKGPVWSAPAVADGKVFAASLDHTLYALNENTGWLIWSYNTSASRLYGSPAVACGKVFIGSENGKVYAFGPEESKVHWYHVDRVTLTILLKEMYVEPPMQPVQLYAEFTGPFEMFYEPIMNPVCTIWHVVYPLSHYSELFHIIGWVDNGDGVLSFCDQIQVVYLATGEVRWYHVEEIACDIILTKKCFYDPIGSQWHELYPEFCELHNLKSWNDTNHDGKLSPSDQIALAPAFTPEQWDEFWSMGDVNRDGYINLTDVNRIAARFGWTGLPGGIPEDINSDGTVNMKDASICALNYGKNIWTYFGISNKALWYHVDNITLTLKLTENVEPPVLLYAEFMAPFSQYFEPIMNPLSTRWHVIYPPESFCREFHITSWEDNGDGVLSFCDTIDVEYADEPGVIHWYHVEVLSCDIKISRTADIAVTNVKPYKTVVGQGYNCRINVTVTNEGPFPETFDLTFYAVTMPPGTPIGTLDVGYLMSGETRTITFTWNTSGFAKGNYTIWAYAWPVPDETHTADNTLTDGWIVVTVIGDINGDFKVDIKDLVLVIKYFGSYPSHPTKPWNPNADINGDFKVDIKDLVLVIKHFGEHYP